MWVEVSPESRGRGFRSLGPVITESCELPNMGSGIETWVLYNNSTQSSLWATSPAPHFSLFLSPFSVSKSFLISWCSIFCGVSSILRSNSFSRNFRISIIKFICCLVVMVLLWDSISCSLGWPSSCYVAEDNSELLFCLYLSSAAVTGIQYPFL